MISFLADENFNNDILRGLWRRNPGLDILRVQDVGLVGASDPDILDWAFREGRVLLTHDAATVPHYAWERVRNGIDFAGVCEVVRSTALSRVIEDLLLIAECSQPEELRNQVCYLPL